jgi:hypothetical protein
MALQLIEFMRDIFNNPKIPIYLRPYKVISTVTDVNGENQLGGIIEMIKPTKSRDEIGKEGSASLFEYYK